MPGFICELTPDCNLNCAFCYNTWRDPAVPRPQPLAPERMAELLVRVFGEADASWATFAGGEPLQYEGLEHVVAAVRQACPSTRLGLATNGTLLTDARLDALIEAGITHVELPLFSASETRYRLLTGADKLLEARQAMTRVKARRLSLTVASVLLADGLDGFEDVLKTAFALGADRIDLNPFTPTGHGVAACARFALSRGLLARFLARADRLAAAFGVPVAVTIPVEDCLLPHAEFPHLRFGVCLCGKEKWVIGPDGTLRTCEQNDAILGDLSVTPFRTLAVDDAVVRFRADNRTPRCDSCAAYPECGGGCRFRRRA